MVSVNACYRHVRKLGQKSGGKGKTVMFRGRRDRGHWRSETDRWHGRLV